MNRMTICKDSDNVYWQDIPSGSRIFETKTSWQVHLEGEDEPRTAFWMGSEAVVAQAKLRTWAVAGVR